MSYNTRLSTGSNSYYASVAAAISHVSVNLTAPRKRMLEGELIDLIERNHALGKPDHGFLLGGQFHTDLQGTQARGISKEQIHDSLRDEGMTYLAALTSLSNDYKRIGQALSLLLGPSTSDQDLRDALPDMLKDTLPPSSRNLPRLKEPLWSLRNSVMQMNQYKVIEPLLFQYYTHRILI